MRFQIYSEKNNWKFLWKSICIFVIACVGIVITIYTYQFKDSISNKVSVIKNIKNERSLDLFFEYDLPIILLCVTLLFAFISWIIYEFIVKKALKTKV